MANIKSMSREHSREAGFIAAEIAAQRLHDLIHERLLELQDREQLTQAELARRIGVPEQQVSRWLNRANNMTIKSAGRVLAGLEAYLGFELERFETIYVQNHVGSLQPNINIEWSKQVSVINTTVMSRTTRLPTDAQMTWTSKLTEIGVERTLKLQYAMNKS